MPTCCWFWHATKFAIANASINIWNRKTVAKSVSSLSETKISIIESCLVYNDNICHNKILKFWMGCNWMQCAIRKLEKCWQLLARWNILKNIVMVQNCCGRVNSWKISWVSMQIYQLEGSESTSLRWFSGQIWNCQKRELPKIQAPVKIIIAPRNTTNWKC